MDGIWSNHEPMDSTDTPGVCSNHPSCRRKHPTAEELAAESMAADMEKWITYVPGRDSASQESFSEWLANNLPSQVSRADGIGHIAVAAPGYDVMDDTLEDLIGAQEAWEQLKASGRPINLRTITDIAKAYGVIKGKWLFYTSTGLKVDHLWSLVAQGVVEGRCGVSATVSPYNPYSDAESHVIGVYNSDFTDYEQVMDLEQAIRLLGIKCQMMYKPVVYSKLGVYSNNEWGLQPSVYKSVYDIIKGCSKVMETNTSSPHDDDLPF